MLASLYLSFTNYALAPGAEWIGLENYRRMLFDDSRYISSIVVTGTYVFVSVPLVVAFALLLAVILNQGIKLLGLYRALIYLPSLLGSSVAVALLWRRVFGTRGMVNAALGIVGIEGRSWLGDPDSAIYTLIALNVWTFGAAMVIFLAGLRQIPSDLYGAAAVDGAGPIQKFRYVTLPLITPLILFNLIMNFIQAFQAFTQAYVISGGTGGPADSTLFYTLYLYQQAFSSFNMGYASAIAWVLLLTIGFFTGLLLITSRYWVHYES